MPTTYTHDLFGKQVYRQLPDEMKAVIRKNGNLYRIGLHGPDLLFYHLFNGKVNKTGVAMHGRKGRAFFDEGMAKVREDRDEALLAYLLGFGCHYLLDSCCHPYVYRMVEEGVISHTNLEKEYDRYLLKLNGRDPNHYYPLESIPVRERYARTIHKAIPVIPEHLILTAWRIMRIATRLFVSDDGGFRKKAGIKITRALRLKSAEELMEHFMGYEELPGSEEAIQGLHEKYLEAVKEAPKELEELYALSKEDLPLSERWDRTYNG